MMLIQSRDWEANWDLKESKVLRNFDREMQFKRR